MVPTGLSVFSNYGVKLIETDFKDYYYNLLKPVKKLSLEEVLIHALVRLMLVSSSREISYTLLVIAKNRKKLNEKRFLETARDWGVESSAKQCIEFVNAVLVGKEVAKQAVNFGMGVELPAFPDVVEFNELLTQ